MNVRTTAPRLRQIETGLPGVHVLEPCSRNGVGAEHADHADGPLPRMRLAASQTMLLGQDDMQGLRYPWPDECAQLIRVTHGEVYAVAVDVRHGSPTFTQRAAAVLTAGNQRQLWIPHGFAHGLCALSAHTECTIAYTATRPPPMLAIRWNDGVIAVDWPVSHPRLPTPETEAPFLGDIEPRDLPAYTG